jgi:Uma2 family endonuclease
VALNLDTADAATLHLLATLRDDTEEDLVGSDLHQDAITDIHIGLATYAQEQGLPWYVTKQVMLIAMLGRQEWHPSPDVYVVPGVSAHPRTSYDTRVEPFPPFIVEVASSSTVDRDLDVKRRLYELLGAREYLIFDPTGESLGTVVRAWHSGAPGAATGTAPPWEPWEPDEGGIWRSAVLGLGLQPPGASLRVVRPNGSLVPTWRELIGLPQQVARLQEELRRLRGETGTP